MVELEPDEGNFTGSRTNCKPRANNGALMVRHPGYPKAARTIEKAVEVAVGDRKIRTRDLGGEASTRQLGKAIAELVATL